MSIRMMEAAFREQRVGGTTKLVLLALADHANDDGECWPGTKRVMEKAGIKSAGTLRSHYRKLEEAGVLTREPQYREDGSQTSNLFRINLPPGSDQPPPRLDSAALEPSIEPTQEVNSCDEVDSVFQHYLSAFPNKRQKKADEGQRKVIRNALKFGTVEELKTCIDANAASDFHRQGKYNSLSLILAPKTRGKNYPSGRSQREQIDFWLDRAGNTGGLSEDERARIREEWVAARNRWAEGEGPDPGPRPNYEKGVSQ